MEKEHFRFQSLLVDGMGAPPPYTIDWAARFCTKPKLQASVHMRPVLLLVGKNAATPCVSEVPAVQSTELEEAQRQMATG